MKHVHFLGFHCRRLNFYFWLDEDTNIVSECGSEIESQGVHFYSL